MTDTHCAQLGPLYPQSGTGKEAPSSFHIALVEEEVDGGGWPFFQWGKGCWKVKRNKQGNICSTLANTDGQGSSRSCSLHSL